jgi:hypothetical protein
MQERRRAILWCVTALVVVGAATPILVRAAGKQPKKTDGSYQVTFGGYYTGTGTANVKNKKVMIKGTVEHDGQSFSFVAPNLQLDGDHFAGTANVAGGTKLTLHGRLDGYDADADFRGARLLCTYVDDAGHRGRIAGVLQ